MSQLQIHWNARDDLKMSNAIARELFYFVSILYDHPVYNEELGCMLKPLELKFRPDLSFR